MAGFLFYRNLFKMLMMQEPLKFVFLLTQKVTQVTHSLKILRRIKGLPSMLGTMLCSKEVIGRHWPR